MGWGYGPQKTKAQVLETVQTPLAIIESKKPAANTVEWKTGDGCRRIRLHNTDILTFGPDDEWVSVNSGGYKTVTTRRRLGEYLPRNLQVGSLNGVWYLWHVVYPQSGQAGRVEVWRVPFFDGIRTERIGGRHSTRWRKPAPSMEMVEGGRRRRLVEAFMREFKALEEVPNLNAGDCLVCQARTSSLTNPETRRRDPGHDCVLSHVEEKYIHGTLIMNAFLWAGYSTEQLPFVYRDKARAARVLRRYVRAQLGLPQ